MKIAIFHNFMDNIGGAEIVSLNLARELNADIYTTNFDLENIKKMGFDDCSHKIKSIGKIPTQSPFRQQIALWRFRKLNLKKEYNLYIISGDWAMPAVVNNHPNIWYVHSPLNEIWAFKDYIRKELMSSWKRPIYDLWVWINRSLTLSYSKKVDTWVCNSLNTKNRIKKYYQKDATVINPPIDTKKYLYGESKNYWLSVNRLSINKRVDMQIKAFEKMPDEKLIIVGSYEKGAKQFENYKKYIESIKPKNVEILHFASKEELIKLYSECKGFITTARDEDFGMTAVEAMASGKPVIAPNEGGYKETVKEDNGIIIDDINGDKIIQAIEKINAGLEINPVKYKDACIKQAKNFDSNKFIEKIKEKINAK